MAFDGVDRGYRFSIRFKVLPNWRPTDAFIMQIGCQCFGVALTLDRLRNFVERLELFAHLEPEYDLHSVLLKSNWHWPLSGSLLDRIRRTAQVSPFYSRRCSEVEHQTSRQLRAL